MPVTLVLLALSLLAQTKGPDTDVTLPAHAQVVAQAEGRGVQTYSCKAQGVAYQWVFTGPEAKLFDASNQQVGTHGAGPSWVWSDGSMVTGKVLQMRISADPMSVPWLLLAATPAAGKPGQLAGITFVRRSETKGGVAPADGCDEGHVGTTVRVPYTATYAFYAPQQ